MLSHISHEFYGCGISSMDTSNGIIRGRPYGGLAILYRKSIAPKCKVINFDDNRIYGIEVTMPDGNLLLLNVYLPYESHNNFDEFMQYLGKINSIIQDWNTPYVCVLGDFNADTYKDRVRNNLFGNEFIIFCRDNQLTVSDLDILSGDRDVFTHYSDAHHTVSWLDHCVSSSAAHTMIQHINIRNDVMASDHLPLCISLCCDVTVTTNECPQSNPTKPSVVWSSVNDTDRQLYSHTSDVNLQHIHLPVETITCNDPNCLSLTHRRDIDQLYGSIIDALYDAGLDLTQCPYVHKHHNVPGWNDFCRDAHDQAREAFRLWCSHSKPRQGAIHNLMVRTRAHFKYALRYCKRNEQQIIADKLAAELSENEYINF